METYILQSRRSDSRIKIPLVATDKYQAILESLYKSGLFSEQKVISRTRNKRVSDEELSHLETQLFLNGWKVLSSTDPELEDQTSE